MTVGNHPNDWRPLDVMTVNRKGGDDSYPPVILLCRDFRDPAWLAIVYGEFDQSHGQIVRIHDCIAHRYHARGDAVGVTGGHYPIRGLREALAKARW